MSPGCVVVAFAAGGCAMENPPRLSDAGVDVEPVNRQLGPLL